MNSAAHNDTTFGERAKRRRDKQTYRCKNNRRIEFFRRHFVGTASPNRAKFFRFLLCCFVARASKRE